MKNTSRIVLGLAVVAGIVLAGCSNTARTNTDANTTTVKAKEAKGGCCGGGESAGCTEKK